MMTPKPLQPPSFEPVNRWRLPSVSTVLWTTLLSLALGAALLVAPRQQAPIGK